MLAYTPSAMGGVCTLSLSLPYAGVCWRMLAYAVECWRMLTYALDTTSAMGGVCTLSLSLSHQISLSHTHNHTPTRNPEKLYLLALSEGD